jgi:hypothetical protein
LQSWENHPPGEQYAQSKHDPGEEPSQKAALLSPDFREVEIYLSVVLFSVETDLIHG